MKHKLLAAVFVLALIAGAGWGVIRSLVAPVPPPVNLRPEEFPPSVSISSVQQHTGAQEDSSEPEPALQSNRTDTAPFSRGQGSVDASNQPQAPLQTEQSEQSEQLNSPIFHTVEESYFDDALFIGDSRTVGLRDYGRLGAADYFADEGMSVFNLFSTQTSDTGFCKTDLSGLLASKSYGKIYMMLGINELGYSMDSLMNQYKDVLSSIQAAQPEAKIILCANLNVVEEKTKYASWLTSENVTTLQQPHCPDGGRRDYLLLRRQYTVLR